MQWHRGALAHLSGSPDLAGADGALRFHIDGGILVADDGTVAWSGPWDERPADEEPVTDYQGAFLLPGFVDTHLHFPQVHCVDGFGGGQLLPWLERVVFPAEARLADPDHARRCAELFCARLIAAGTTTSLVFGSQFPVAQEALVDRVEEVGLRMVLGRTVMTVGPSSAAALLTTEARAVELVRDEIERWHPLGEGDRADARVQIAIVPRFALSVTAATLVGLGELAHEYRDRGVYVTTHISENGDRDDGEVAEVRARFGVEEYLDVYDGRFLTGSRVGGPSLLGRRTVLAHAVHCSDGEFARIAEAGTSIAHCPVSQQFLGSGTLPWRRAAAGGMTIAVGSDISAGDEWFIPRVLNACFKAHMNEAGPDAVALTPAQLLFLGTLAGARALDLEARIGNLDPGKDADFVVIDPGRCPELEAVIEGRVAREDPDEDRDALLFALLMAARETAVASTYVRGRRLDGVGQPGGVGVGRG
jgi:guanine deaminase